MKIKAILAAEKQNTSVYIVISPTDPNLDGVVVNAEQGTTILVPFWSYVTREPFGLIRESAFHKQLWEDSNSSEWEKKFYRHSIPFTASDLISAQKYIKSFDI